MYAPSTESYEFGDFRLSVGERRLEHLDGSPIRLLPEKAFQTLVYLVKNSGRLIEKGELLAAIWPDTIVEEGNLGKAVHAIRQVLSEKTGEYRYIETIPKHGYRFVADVRRVASRDFVSAGIAPATRGSRSGILGTAPSDGAPRSKLRNAFEGVQLARVNYRQMTAPTTIEARQLLSESLWLDPNFAPAYSLSAELATLEVIVGLKTPMVGFAEAHSAISRARELGADTEDFFAAAGYVALIADWDFTTAEMHLRRALALNPHYGTANRMLGETYMFQRRHEEADFYINRAQVDELIGIHSLNILAINYFFARRFAEMIEISDRMLALSPMHLVAAWNKCWALEQLGRFEDAIAGYDKILALPHGEPALRWAGYAYAVAGERPRALQTAERLEAAGREHSISPTHLAAVYGALGDLERAVLYVEKAYEMRDPFTLWIAADPRFDTLRSHPKFERVIELVGFDRWRSRAATSDPPAGNVEPGIAASVDAGVQGGGRPRFWIIPAAAGVCLVAILGWIAISISNGGSEQARSFAAVQNGKGSRAYDLYVRGKVKVDTESREETEAGIRLLEEAVTLDPDLAEAFVQLARGYNTIAFKYTSGAESRRFHENAEVAIEKALALNPNLADAHFARGLILWTQTEGFPHEQAIQSHLRAVGLDPERDEPHHQLSLIYSHVGLIDEAEKSVARSLELNPNNTLARFRSAVYKQYRGDFAEAIAAFQSIPRDRTPLLIDRSIAETLIQLGRDEEAAAIVDKYLERFPNDEGGSFTSVKALLSARAGDQREAERLAEKAAAIGEGFGHFHHTAYNIAAVYARLGRPEDAIKWLAITVETGFPNHPYFAIDPNFGAIRNHPSFIQFMARQRPRYERHRADL